MLRSLASQSKRQFQMKITRRQLGGFAAAFPFAGAVSAAAVRDPDVVIIGAGAAGIAAAQILINGGRRVQVIEAAARIGGRCFTDTATFGVPFDRGAAWLRGGIVLFWVGALILMICRRLSGHGPADR